MAGRKIKDILEKSLVKMLKYSYRFSDDSIQENSNNFPILINSLEGASIRDTLCAVIFQVHALTKVQITV
jgi:hypothetical protein